MPRIKKVLPEGGLETIRTLGERGVRETDIAKALGMSYPTWLRIKNENEDAKQALQEARAVEEEALVGVLYEAATKEKNLTAAMFLLKTRHGYLEGKDINAGNAVQVNITIPGSMDPEDYKKQIEVKQDE